MRTISNSEFAAHPEMYLDMAREQDVCVQKGQEMYRIVYDPVYPAQQVLQPDDDLRNSITSEELLAGIYGDLETFFADRR